MKCRHLWGETQQWLQLSSKPKRSGQSNTMATRCWNDGCGQTRGSHPWQAACSGLAPFIKCFWRSLDLQHSPWETHCLHPQRAAVFRLQMAILHLYRCRLSAGDQGAPGIFTKRSSQVGTRDPVIPEGLNTAWPAILGSPTVRRERGRSPKYQLRQQI